jgi:hypothetical protein
MEFSVLDVITLSATVTKDCIVDPNKTVLMKIWAMFTIVNNFMNKEAFFYIDLIICVAFSISNAAVTKPMKAFVYYVDGALAINAIFLWYFCYCRYLNGKDVITLRRSIQLLSHSFQISLIGLLVLCNETHDFIVDDDSDHDDLHNRLQQHQHNFQCTGPFLASNALRIIWHFMVLTKSVLDEYFGSFLITRGVAVDFVTILLSPILIAIALFTDLFAVDLRTYLIRALRVNYEVNDITSTTKFYESLADSRHRPLIEAITFFLIVEVTAFGAFAKSYTDNIPLYHDDERSPYDGRSTYYEACDSSLESLYFTAIYIMISLSGIGWGLMSEFYFCKQLKSCTLFMFLACNLVCRLYLGVTCGKYMVCKSSFSYRFDDEGNFYDDDDYSFYRQESTVTELWFIPFLVMTIISGATLVVFIWDNAKILKVQHIWSFVDYCKFVCFVLIYCPLVPMYTYFVVPVASTGASAAKAITKHLSSGISMQTFVGSVIAASRDDKSVRDSTVLSTEAVVSNVDINRVFDDQSYLCRLILSWILSVPILPVGLITDVCLRDIQSFLRVHRNMSDQIYDTLDGAVGRRKLLPIYFFQILTALNLLDEDKIDWPGRYCPQEARFLRHTGVVYSGYAIVGVGSVLMVEYFIWKEVKYCGAFVFNLMNFAARLYVVVVLRVSYVCSLNAHSADDVSGNEVEDDYALQVPSVDDVSYIRLIIGLALAAAITVLFCADNADMIKERHVWVLADYLKLLWFVLVRYPLTTGQQAVISLMSMMSVRPVAPSETYPRNFPSSGELCGHQI